MCRTLRAVVLATALFLPWIAGCELPDAPASDKPAPAQPAKPPRKVAFPPASLDLANGHVVQITDKVITIRTDGAKEFKTFPLHDALAAGKYQECASPAFSYRAKDLRVGDVVSVGIHTEGNQTYCAEICLRKRPGGRVPNSPRSIALGGDTCSHALRQNAENDFADFGIPLPKAYQRVDPEVSIRMAEEGKQFAKELEEARRQTEAAKKQPPPQE